MCLGLPGEVLNVMADEASGLDMATVRFGPVTQTVCLSMVQAQPGDFVVCHAGFAITRLNEDAAAKTLSLMDALKDETA